ncbi:MAG: hypothetical protein K9J13_09770 [Saprospiraceae bacterium]|nr:hypothetical protein [Saprospiraceae bacterium]
MKATTLLFVSFLLLNFSIASSNDEITQNPSLKGETNVYCIPDLYNLTTIWAGEFCILHPNLKINVIKISESSIAEALNGDKNLCFISKEYYSKLNTNPIWQMKVGRDVTVPIINSKNPYLDEIYKQGVSSEKFIQAFTSSEEIMWGTILGNDQNVPLNCYMIDDGSVNNVVADYLKVNQSIIKGIKVKSDSELIASIQKDPYAIGFCKMTSIIDYTNQSIVENVKLLPIDKNGNGKIDYMEKIYDDLNDFSQGIWIGKYPKTLINSFYTIAKNRPTNEIEVAFLKWVLSDGQQFLNPNGYNNLLAVERQQNLDVLLDNKVMTSASNDNNAISKILIIILVVLIVGAFILNALIRRMKYKKTASIDSGLEKSGVFNEDSVSVPKGLYFDKTHTWVFMEKDGIARIGIDDFLNHITGPITRIKMKNQGDKIKKGEQILSIIQNGKQLNIYSPISGTITAQNKIIEKKSSLINSSPYSDGWVYLIEPTNWLREIQFLFMEKKYKEWLKNEFSRLKDFLSVYVNPYTVDYAHVLQDGGELKDNILTNLKPEVWEDFQTNFIDTSR